jgi:hypothetical protein
VKHFSVYFNSLHFLLFSALFLIPGKYSFYKNSVTYFEAKFTTIMAQIKHSTDIDVETFIILNDCLK